jgi:hypothetical protein
MNFSSQANFDSQVCKNTKVANPSLNLTGFTMSDNVVNQISSTMMQHVAGVAINGVLILASAEVTTGI